MEIKKDILWRVYLCFIGVVVLSLFILGKAAVIQRVQGNYWRSMGDSMHQKIVPISAERGTIFSEDGQMLSTSIPRFDVYMDLMADGLRAKNGKIYYKYIDSLSGALAGYFKDKTAAQYRAVFDAAYKAGNRYFALKKDLSFEDFKNLRSFPLINLGKNKSGIIVEQNSKRIAPFGLLANRTIGLSREYVNSDGKVKKMNVGLEMSYDSLLNGQNGQRLVRYISGGAVPVEGAQVEPENGRDIYTTLDVNMQDVTETALLRMMLQADAQYGTAIVMETETGKIKALANLGRNENGSYWENDNYALRVTEPGSTIKLVTFLAALDKGTSKPDDYIEVGSAGQMTVGPRLVTDAEQMPKSVLTIKECIAYSSNVGMSKVALKAFGKKPEEFREYLHRYHMDVKSPVDLAHVPKPLVAPLATDNGGLMNMITMSFGYSVQVSPLQTLTLYNAIANNGKMMKPYLVGSIRNNGVPVKEFSPVVMESSICKENTLKAAQQALEMTVQSGTAAKAMAGMPFRVAGKTGTAHVADGNIKYDDGVYQGTFVGYFPVEKPQYSCIVVIRTKPHPAFHFGGQLGAPVFREIATKLYSMYVERKTPNRYQGTADSSAYWYAGSASAIRHFYNGLHIPYTDSAATAPWATVYARHYQPVVSSNAIKENVMPNVHGMGLRDAIALLEKMGMKVKISGSGKVISQSLQPGAGIGRGQTIYLILS